MKINKNVTKIGSENVGKELRSKLTNLQSKLKSDSLVPKLRRLGLKEIKKHLKLSAFKLLKKQWNSEKEVSFEALTPRVKSLKLHSLEERVLSVRTLAPKLRRLKSLELDELARGMPDSNPSQKEHHSRAKTDLSFQRLSDSRDKIHNNMQKSLNSLPEQFEKNQDRVLRPLPIRKCNAVSYTHLTLPTKA